MEALLAHIELTTKSVSLEEAISLLAETMPLSIHEQIHLYSCGSIAFVRTLTSSIPFGKRQDRQATIINTPAAAQDSQIDALLKTGITFTSFGGALEPP
jgi:hypothetical protein